MKNRKNGDIFLVNLMCSVRNKRCIPPPVVSRSVSLPFNKSFVSSPLHNDKLSSNLSIYDPAQSQSLISFNVRKCTRPADNLGISGVTLTESVIDLRKSLQDTTTWYQRNLVKFLTRLLPTDFTIGRQILENPTSIPGCNDNSTKDWDF